MFLTAQLWLGWGLESSPRPISYFIRHFRTRQSVQWAMKHNENGFKKKVLNRKRLRIWFRATGPSKFHLLWALVSSSHCSVPKTSDGPRLLLLPSLIEAIFSNPVRFCCSDRHRLTPIILRKRYLTLEKLFSSEFRPHSLNRIIQSFYDF